jgi:hypothetical protein
MPTEKPEAFTVKAEEKIADQNQAAYKRLNKRSYPRESLLVTNLPYLLLGSALIITIILSIISARWLWPKLAEYMNRFRARGPSSREVELETRVEELQNSLKQTKDSVAPLERENKWYRQKLDEVMASYEIPYSGRKKIYLLVTSRRPGGQPFRVFFPGLDRDVVYDNEVLFEALMELLGKPEEFWRKHINLPNETVAALKGLVELKEKRQKLAKEAKTIKKPAREFAHAGRI